VFRVRDAWLRRLAAKHHIYVPSLVADVRVEDEVSTADADAPTGEAVPRLVAATGMTVPTPPPAEPAVRARAGVPT
jgi:hypothetical protein